MCGMSIDLKRIFVGSMISETVSCLHPFRVFSSKLIKATLPVIGKEGSTNFVGLGGLTPRPSKIFGWSIDAVIGSERSECYTDAGKMEKLTTGGL